MEVSLYAEKAGFETAVDDLRLIHNLLQQDHPYVPHIMMGHSMGSFLVRRYMQKYSDDKQAVILSGTGYHRGLVGKAGMMLAKLETIIFSPTHKSKLMNKLSFGQYQKHFQSGSWLSRDKAEVSLYNEDPFSGFISTSQFFVDLLSGIDTLHKPSELKKVNTNTPMLFISGAEDPVGNFTNGVKKAIRDYEQVGVKTIDVIFYEDARHELTFEKNRDEVINDIYNWIKTVY
ncbi:serine aminopeptidase domain-containing protein [Natronobacillus azotifigens]|uniref:Alpha/beta hydrolase n=1 Tax=Natronobacillus azotifigens TaxID=472978 RepID=A0A9J6RCY0_9BACI|nr:alpha/beta hydrolase [Natronobacillus azotifigens]